ncbi:MAG: hypothetical protein KDD63_06135, partial [Bacteroidetes bacterium]|nr:hypothetical protein [Bacteroidota bacterium]
SPQLFWIKKIRTTPWMIFVVCIFVNIGMWFERFVIIVTSLHRDFLPSSWADYAPTYVEVGILLGTFGLFMTCFFLFSKYLPVVNMFEVKTLLNHPKKPADLPDSLVVKKAEETATKEKTEEKKEGNE